MLKALFRHLTVHHHSPAVEEMADAQSEHRVYARELTETILEVDFDLIGEPAPTAPTGAFRRRPACADDKAVTHWAPQYENYTRPRVVKKTRN